MIYPNGLQDNDPATNVLSETRQLWLADMAWFVVAGDKKRPGKEKSPGVAAKLLS
jgi:hypothetical protein